MSNSHLGEALSKFPALMQQMCTASCGVAAWGDSERHFQDKGKTLWLNCNCFNADMWIVIVNLSPTLKILNRPEDSKYIGLHMLICVLDQDGFGVESPIFKLVCLNKQGQCR